MNNIKNEYSTTCSFKKQLIPYLQKETTYILLVSTYNINMTGSFSIIAFGPNKVTLKHSGKCILAI